MCCFVFVNNLDPHKRMSLRTLITTNYTLNGKFCSLIFYLINIQLKCFILVLLFLLILQSLPKIEFLVVVGRIIFVINFYFNCYFNFNLSQFKNECVDKKKGSLGYFSWLLILFINFIFVKTSVFRACARSINRCSSGR